jgi:hypothetical protein
LITYDTTRDVQQQDHPVDHIRDLLVQEVPEMRGYAKESSDQGQEAYQGSET